jgi:hypothetical protein
MANPTVEWSFDEVSGNVVNTGSLGTGYNFTLTGNNARTSAGGGYTFGGAAPNSKGLVQSAADAQTALNGNMAALNTTSRTVMFWGKQPGANPSWVMEYYRNPGDDTGVFGWLLLSGTFRFRAKDSSNNVYERNLTSDVSNFHHYAATHNGTRLRAYVDGVQVGADVSMPVAVWNADAIRLIDQAGSSVNIDHVRIFDVELTATEINTWMGIPTPTSTTTDLVIQDATVATSTDNAVLTLIMDLAIQKMLLATRHDQANFTQIHNITINKMFLQTAADMVNFAAQGGGNVSIADVQAQKLPALSGINGTVPDMLNKYYAGLSGLVPASQFSVTDHQRKYWETQTSLSGRSMADLEKAFYDMLLVPSGSLSDREFIYWTGL